MKKFFLLIAALTAILIVAQYFIFDVLQIPFSNLYYIFYGYLFVITLLIHKLLSSQINKRPQAFVTYFMGAMSVKLFLSLIIMLFVLWFNREIKIQLAVVFMILYLAYTFLSVMTILPKLKK